jgi:hypothetical protein
LQYRNCRMRTVALSIVGSFGGEDRTSLIKEWHFIGIGCISAKVTRGIKQFSILKKVFEYGFTTRHLGIIYSRGLDEHGDNVTYCFADSGHSLPRSYGCTLSMMNGGVTSLSAKRHTLTASSTCHRLDQDFATYQSSTQRFGSSGSTCTWPFSPRWIETTGENSHRSIRSKRVLRRHTETSC